MKEFYEFCLREMSQCGMCMDVEFLWTFTVAPFLLFHSKFRTLDRAFHLKWIAF